MARSSRATTSMTCCRDLRRERLLSGRSGRCLVLDVGAREREGQCARAERLPEMGARKPAFLLRLTRQPFIAPNAVKKTAVEALPCFGLFRRCSLRPFLLVQRRVRLPRRIPTPFQVRRFRASGGARSRRALSAVARRAVEARSGRTLAPAPCVARYRQRCDAGARSRRGTSEDQAADRPVP
jgi:hypothetical protein